MILAYTPLQLNISSKGGAAVLLYRPAASTKRGETPRFDAGCLVAEDAELQLRN